MGAKRRQDCYRLGNREGHILNSLLVIDDSEDNQLLLRLVFESEGYTVFSAANGLEALRMLINLNNLPSLILLDANMPVMNGYEFRRAQALINRISLIPVFVITGEDGADMKEDMLQPAKILCKPLQMDQLVASVTEVMSRESDWVSLPLH